MQLRKSYLSRTRNPIRRTQITLSSRYTCIFDEPCSLLCKRRPQNANHDGSPSRAPDSFDIISSNDEHSAGQSSRLSGNSDRIMSMRDETLCHDDCSRILYSGWNSHVLFERLLAWISVSIQVLDPNELVGRGPEWKKPS